MCALISVRIHPMALFVILCTVYVLLAPATGILILVRDAGGTDTGTSSSTEGNMAARQYYWYLFAPGPISTGNIFFQYGHWNYYSVSINGKSIELKAPY